MKQNPKSGWPLVAFRDVTLQIRDSCILKHIDWCIRSNEHWAIVGSNGSGKSVLARSLYGAVPIVGGEVEYHFLIDRESKSRRDRYQAPEDFVAHISFEDQRHLIGLESSYYQSRWDSAEGGGKLTALDVLSDDALDVSSSGNTENSKAGKRSRRFSHRRAVKQLGIGHLLDRKIVHLSNGEMRKVLIAKGLLQSPLILILDEPFVGLDYRSRRTLRRMMDELMKGDTRIVLVTSRIDEIPSRITHVLWVEDGRVAAAGDRRTILDNMQSKQPSIRRKQVEQIRRIAAKHRPRTPSKSTALIEMRDASVTYDGVAVLKGINWTMREGENWAVLGPNGSGKTTLLSLILADNPQAYSNDISLFGRKRGSGESVWDIKKKIGWVSPEVQIHYQKTMTSYDVLCSGFFDSIGLYRECSARQESIARTWMRTLGLWRLADRKFDELSAGQQRMILIARASIKNPRLLILDEPCQGLDSVNRQIVLEAIDAVNCQARCNLIYVTHRLNEIPDSITHVLRLRRGHVVRKGDRVSVLRK